MLYTANALDELAEKKCSEGCREKLKKLAINYLPEVDPITFMRGMLYSSIATEGCGPKTVTAVIINRGILIFDKTGDEVFKLMSEITKQGMVTPRRVLIKMALSRFTNFTKELNHRKSQAQKFINKSDPFIQKWINFNIPKIITTRLEFMAIFAKINQNECQRYNDLKIFMERTDLDDSIIAEAWSLLEVQQVMDG